MSAPYSPREEAILHSATVDVLVRLARGKGVLTDRQIYRMLACNPCLTGAVMDKLLRNGWADLEMEYLVLTDLGASVANNVRDQLVSVLLAN